MFSHNNMISQKQLRCMLMLAAFSGSIFVQPYLFANMFGTNMVIGIIIYILMAALYIGLIFLSGGYEGTQQFSKENKYEYKLLKIVYIVRYFIRLVFYITLGVKIIGEGQVPFVDKEAGNSFGNLMVLLPLLVVAFYGADRNVEKQGRINEMLFGTAFVPFVIMILFGFKEFELKALLHGGSMYPGIIIRCYALLTFVVPVEIYPQLRLNKDMEKISSMRTYIEVMSMIILVAALSFVMAGIYGLNGMSNEPMAAVAIMRYIELPMGVLQRFDVLMVWFFMTGIFVMISGTLFGMRKQLLDLATEKMTALILVIIVFAAAATCMNLPSYELTLDAFIVFGAFVDVPLSVMTMIKRWREKKNVQYD